MRSYKNKSSYLSVSITVFSLLIISSLSCSKTNKTTIEEITKNPEKYDKKMVRVEGEVVSPEVRVSQKGNKYITFFLKDKTGSEMKVFSYENLSLKENDSVEVFGKYHIAKDVPPNYTFYNEIEAAVVKVIKR